MRNSASDTSATALLNIGHLHLQEMQDLDWALGCNGENNCVIVKTAACVPAW